MTGDPERAISNEFRLMSPRAVCGMQRSSRGNPRGELQEVLFVGDWVDLMLWLNSGAPSCLPHGWRRASLEHR